MTIAARISKPLGAALAVAAVAAPAAAAKPIEPLTLKGSKAQDKPAVATDLRSPDAKDAGSPVVAIPAGGAPAIRVVESAGFDWGDAGVGAGTVLLLGLVAINGSTVVARRRLQRALNT